MIGIKELEIKHSSEIEKHFYYALPLIAGKIPFFISTIHQDSTLGYDLTFSFRDMPDIIVSIRIRENKFLSHNDLTIRKKPIDSYDDIYCEFDKIKNGIPENEGKLHVYLYANLSKDGLSFARVIVAGVPSISRCLNKYEYEVKVNRDGSRFVGVPFAHIKETNLIRNDGTKVNGLIYEYHAS